MDLTPRNYVKFHSAYLKSRVTGADTGAVPAVTPPNPRADQIMKTRKQKTPAKKRAQRAPAPRRAAKTRPAAARKARRAKAVPIAPAVESRNAAAASAEALLTLAAECTVAEADSLKAGLVRLLGDPGAVALDVSGLQRIDTAGLQLLAAFVRDRRTAGHRTEWRGRAPALDAAAGLLGLRSMLELPGEEGR